MKQHKFTLGLFCVLFLVSCTMSLKELSHNLTEQTSLTTTETRSLVTPTLVLLASPETESQPIVTLPPIQSSIQTPNMHSCQLGTIAYRAFDTIAIVRDCKLIKEMKIKCLFCNSLSSSPDGRFLAYAGYEKPDGLGEIFTVSLLDGDIAQKTFTSTTKLNLDWSQDGNFIVFDDGGYSSDIIVLNIEKQTTEEITLTSNLESNPVWSPDGTQIAFINREELGQDGELWIMNRDGSNKRKIFDMPIGISQIAWSPLGSEIAFSSPEGCGNIYVIDIHTSSVNQLSHGSMCATNPAWSPDGKMIAFVIKKYQLGTAWVIYWEIVVVEAGGTKMTSIISGEETPEPQALDWLP